MEKKINLVELLKDCPKGMELNCTLYDNCTFDGIEDVGYIDILVNTPSGRIRLSKEGCYIRHDENAKCVIFPKGKTTWEGFVPLYKFKNGDVIIKNNYIAIISHIESNGRIWYHCWYNTKYKNCKIKTDFGIGCINDNDKIRFATEEEKEKLFNVIKDNGCKWNPETKTLEKLIVPKFKVGDRIKKKGLDDVYAIKIVEVTPTIYIIQSGGFIYVESTDKTYELVPNKFDITIFKPFDKVLVRCSSLEKWRIQFFEKYDKTYRHPFVCMEHSKYKQCIPYKGNEHLLDTVDECDEFYKIW